MKKKRQFAELPYPEIVNSWGAGIQLNTCRTFLCATIKVQNTGPLIPVEELEQIWYCFYQVDNTKRGQGLIFVEI